MRNYPTYLVNITRYSVPIKSLIYLISTDDTISPILVPIHPTVWVCSYQKWFITPW